MKGSEVRRDQRVSFPWGRRRVEGTVIGFFGPPDGRFVRVLLDWGEPDEVDFDSIRVVSLRAEYLDKVESAA